MHICIVENLRFYFSFHLFEDVKGVGEAYNARSGLDIDLDII